VLRTTVTGDELGAAGVISADKNLAGVGTGSNCCPAVSARRRLPTAPSRACAMPSTRPASATTATRHDRSTAQPPARTAPDGGTLDGAVHPSQTRSAIASGQCPSFPSRRDAVGGAAIIERRLREPLVTIAVPPVTAWWPPCP
jgi:hypothetical protein